MLNFFKKYGASFFAIGGAALTIFQQPIQNSIATHPAISAGLAALYAVLAHFLPSPVQPQA